MKHAAKAVQIRRAATDDAPAIASVLRKAFAEYEPLYTKKGYAATTPGTHEVLIRMQEGPVWVAVCGADIAGTVSAVAKDAGIYIRGMAVLPATRGLGAGRLLLNEVEAFAAANGCKRLFLSTTPFLDRAIRLYERFGFHIKNEEPSHDLFGTPLFTMERIMNTDVSRA